MLDNYINNMDTDTKEKIKKIAFGVGNSLLLLYI